MMQTGENEQGLRKIIDMTRLISIVVLTIHFYFYCYKAFEEWGLVSSLSDRLLTNITRSGLMNSFHRSKLIALAFLAISLIGAKGRKSDKLNYRTAFAYLFTGLLLYFLSALVLKFDAKVEAIAVAYMGITGMGYILALTGGSLFSRIIKGGLSGDVFNKINESFPQEERLLVNEYSINLPTEYQFRGKKRQGFINWVNPRRSLFIIGSPGSGKSWFLVENIIRQLLEKQFAMFLFDWKFPDLTLVAYNHYLKYKHKYPKNLKFWYVNFKNPGQSPRCNPLSPDLMEDIMDAMEASKTMLLSINNTWAKRQGEFFVESPINFLAAVFWFLRKFRDGQYCTIPHAIELLQLDYERLFSVLNSEEEVRAIISPFISAYQNDVMETVDNQISSLRIPLGRLASPGLYYILSGNDFSLDINNPDEPKIVCLGGDPLKSEALAPVISVICDRMNKIINLPGKMKCATIYDEFATIRVSSIMTVMAQGRSNGIIPVLAVQDFSQVKDTYGREKADAIFNMVGNIISGQVSGETARLLAERFPKIMQDRESMSINSTDTSVSKSKQLESSIQPATISSLSSGEFVGVVADNPDQVIELKAFHAKVINDTAKINREKKEYRQLPERTDMGKTGVIQRNYLQIKQDVQDIADSVMGELLNDPAKQHLVIRKN